MAAIVFLKKDGTDANTFDLEEEKFELLIGRNPQCDIQLHSKQVSSAHALLRRSQQGWFIEDLQSTNGTRLNNIRNIYVGGPRPIKDGDIFQIGRRCFRFKDRTCTDPVQEIVRILKYLMHQRTPFRPSGDFLVCWKCDGKTTSFNGGCCMHCSSNQSSNIFPDTWERAWQRILEKAAPVLKAAHMDTNITLGDVLKERSLFTIRYNCARIQLKNMIKAIL